MQTPFASNEILGSMHGMPFGAELMSPSEYPQLPLVHIHATAAPASRPPGGCGDPWFIAKISGRKREGEGDGEGEP